MKNDVNVEVPVDRHRNEENAQCFIRMCINAAGFSENDSIYLVNAIVSCEKNQFFTFIFSDAEILQFLLLSSNLRRTKKKKKLPSHIVSE